MLKTGNNVSEIQQKLHFLNFKSPLPDMYKMQW